MLSQIRKKLFLCYEYAYYTIKSLEVEVNNIFERKAILFYPKKPNINHIIFKICSLLRYKIITNPADHYNYAIFWLDSTFRKVDLTLRYLNKKIPIININCINISKTTVDKIFHSVFGYSSLINPVTYIGKCVRKSNLNAKHFGQIIICPLKKPEKSFVYQKILNNQVDDTLVMDIRVPVFRGDIPFVYLKYRYLYARFSNTNSKVELSEVNEIFTKDEIVMIIEFCKKIGLDYGELDIIRHKGNNRIYIIDVANTPYGPPNHISSKDRKNAIILLSKSFEKEIYLFT